MKKGTRLYLNITNKCNLNCPFCCMYSSKDKTKFMDFRKFEKIIDNTNGGFELQLEGGEPLLHKDLFLFLEYAISTKRCSKILILTNGILIDNYIKRFVELYQWYGIPMEIKISINYFILENTTNHLEKLSYLLFATKYFENFNIRFNVRKRLDVDHGIEEQLKDYGLFEASNIFYFQGYGKLTGSNYDSPIIVQNIETWQIFSCDGTCFGTDLIARSEYEKTLN